MKNRILCAAIWYNNGNPNDNGTPKNIETGFVICGHRHHNCFATINVLFQGVGLPINANLINQGFLTSDNRFVDRLEAFRIAEQAGQIIDNVGGNVLTTEHIY